VPECLRGLTGACLVGACHTQKKLAVCRCVHESFVSEWSALRGLIARPLAPNRGLLAAEETTGSKSLPPMPETTCLRITCSVPVQLSCAAARQGLSGMNKRGRFRLWSGLTLPFWPHRKPLESPRIDGHRPERLRLVTSGLPICDCGMSNTGVRCNRNCSHGWLGSSRVPPTYSQSLGHDPFQTYDR